MHNFDVIFCGNDFDRLHIVSLKDVNILVKIKSIRFLKHYSFHLQCFLRRSRFCLKGHFLMS